MNKKLQLLLYITAIGSNIGMICTPSFAIPVFSKKELSTLTELRPFSDLFDTIIQSTHQYKDSNRERQKDRLLSIHHMDLLNKERTCPQTDVAYQQAMALFKQKQWAEAKTAFTALLDKGSAPQQVCVHFKLGQVENQLGNHITASQLFVKTYKLVAEKGYPDPLHLGIDSLGESAGAMLDLIGTRSLSDKGIVIWTVNPYRPNTPPAYKAHSILSYEGLEYHDNSQDLFEKIIDYYAMQASLGDAKAIDSIAAVFAGITDPDNPNAKILLKDVFLTDQIRDIFWAYLFNAQKGTYYIYDPKIRHYIANFFINMIDGHSVDIGGTESYLAALAFQNNDLGRAQQFAKYRWVVSKEKDPLAAWVLAKIAYKQQKLNIAKEYYFKALIAAADKKTPKLLQKYIAQENYIIQNIKSNSQNIRN